MLTLLGAFQASAVEASTVRIASWNLEHLAERNGEGCRPRTDKDYLELRLHAEALGADVVALQEVESKAAAERVFPPSGWTVLVEARTMSLGGSCRENPGNRIRAQLTGVAIRKGIAFTRNPDLVELALGRAGLRSGVDVTLNLVKPIRLLAVHLKSGCNSGNAPTDADCPVLFGQVPALEAWIDARGRDGTATVVAGDFNRRLASRGDAIWTDLDDGDPAASDLTLASGSAGASCKSRYREFIDFLVLNRPAAALMKAGSFVEVSVR
jgi:endonuclease/exonuclease/phosphatase family metal-dependent hydrolase